MKKTSFSIIALFFSVLLFSGESTAREGTLTFSWTVDSVTVTEQSISELRVYQDSSDNIVGSESPLTGSIAITTDIIDCSNFWATYATATEESERTDPPIKVCEPSLGDPEPATQIINVGGFKLTIDFEPTND